MTAWVERPVRGRWLGHLGVEQAWDQAWDQEKSAESRGGYGGARGLKAIKRGRAIAWPSLWPCWYFYRSR